MTSLYGANGRMTDPTRADFTVVRDQLRRVYQASSKLRGASNAAKQNAGEGCLFLVMLNDVFLETMKVHPEARSKLKAEITAGAKSMLGLDLNAMRMAEAGFVPK